MALKKTSGTAKSFDDLIAQIIAWATDKSVHGDDAWTLMRNEPWPKGTILRAHGRRKGEHQYIGLMPNTIVKGETYQKWLFTKPNLATHFVWSPNGLNRPGIEFSVDKLAVTVQGTSYTFEAPDIFLSSAQVMHLGVFKQYAPGLDWNEQPGGIGQDYKLFPLQYRIWRNKLNFSPPVLPGCEYPALSYGYDGLPLEQFDYWLIKDDRRLIIVMNNAGNWDSAYLGFFRPFDDNDEKGAYAFPAAVIGGTSGLVSYGENIWYYPGQETPSPVIGVKFDYQPKEWSLTHGIATFACLAEKGTPSQVRAMMPDGTWRTFANYVQERQIIPEPVCSGPTPFYHFVRQAPNLSPEKNWVRPGESVPKEYAHAYDGKERYHIHGTGLQLCADGYGLLGELPYLLFPSAPLKEYGELTIKGKKYLALPNVWEGRKFHLPGYAAYVNHHASEVLEGEDREMDRLSRMMNLLIRMEE